MVVTTVTDMQSDKQETTATHAREGVSVGVVLCDAAGHALHVDDAAAALIGLDPSTGATERLRAWQRFEPRLLDDRGAPLGAERFPARIVAQSGQPVHDVIVVLPAAADCPARLCRSPPSRCAPPATEAPAGSSWYSSM